LLREKISVVIPTTGDSTTIERTIDYLNRCKIPADFARLIVVENGPEPKGERLLQTLKPDFKSIYLYEQIGNKSKALNLAVEHIDSGLVIFFDDDVRVHPEVLTAYAKAIETVQNRSCYFAGPSGVDYDSPPLKWVVPLLPASARGWELPPGSSQIPGAKALGFNWAAFVEDLKNAGGFNASFGPGSGARGQETEMQMRLLAAGRRGMYVPGAMVWHYVPEHRCSAQWVLNRSIEYGRKEHLLNGSNAGFMRKCLFRYRMAAVLVGILDLLGMGNDKGFRWRVKKIHYKYAAGIEK